MQNGPEPPAKRLKTSSAPTVAPVENLARKPAQHLDLRFPPSDPAEQKVHKRSVDALLKLLRKKKKIVVIAGAGISVGAGSKILSFLLFFVVVLCHLVPIRFHKCLLSPTQFPQFPIFDHLMDSFPRCERI